MNDELTKSIGEPSLKEIREAIVKFLNANTPKMVEVDDFFDYLDMVLSEFGNKALTEYQKSNVKYIELAEQRDTLIKEFESKLPKNLVELYEKCTDSKGATDTIDLNFVYRQGIQHCLLLLQYIGIKLPSNKE